MAYLLLQALVAARWSQRSRGRFGTDLVQIWWCWDTKESFWVISWSKEGMLRWEARGITPLSWWRNQWHIMVYNVKCPMKWQRILGWWKESSISIWHLIWHSIWQSFWHSFWHFIWQSIWHPTWHSLWYGLFAVASSCSGQMITEVEGSIWYRFGDVGIPRNLFGWSVDQKRECCVGKQEGSRLYHDGVTSGT